MPRVSVIIPAHDAEAHISQTLDSVVAQTYREWEAVVVDDASTDRTAEIATGFDPRVKVVRLATNGGPAAARNHALAHASGELVAFLDSDDYWLESYLQHQVDVYDSRCAAGGDVGIMACDARVLVGERLLPESYLEHLGFDGEVPLTSLLESNPIYASATCPRRVVDEAGGFETRLRGIEDHDLWLRVVELGHSVVVSRVPLAVYRVRDESLSADPRPIARGTQILLGRAIARGNL